MAKRGTIITLLGLVVGITAGLGVVSLKRYIGSTLMGVLEDELKESCPCTLAYDRIHVSLLRLRAVGTNVRILEHGIEKLSFPKIEADFSLRKISEKQVQLTELRLLSGHAEGVGPDSATFRFVDHLAAPLPPERDRPGRWKIKLQRLAVIDSSFSEILGTARAEGTSVGLTLVRDATNNFDLSASSEKISIAPSTGKPVDIGALATDLYLHDDYIQIKKLSIEQPHAHLGATLRASLKEGNSLTGEMSLLADPGAANFFSPLGGVISSESAISGTLSAPALTGIFRKPENSPLALHIGIARLFLSMNFLVMFNF